MRIMEIMEIDETECLVIPKTRLESMLLTFAENEIRAKKLIEKYELELVELNLINGSWNTIIEVKKERDLLNASILMNKLQEIKARGFKEAIDGLMFEFTGKMNNVNEDGKLTA